MTQHFDADVAIIGYGPSGVAAANVLGHHGVSAVAFERDEEIYPRARAVTVNDWTMRCLQSVGLDDALAADMDVTKALRWVTYDGKQLHHLTFPPSTLGHPRSYAIYQPLMEATLRRGAERYPDEVQVNYGVEVTGVEQDDDGVTVTTAELSTGAVGTIRTRYALACHGGNSTTRERLGVELRGETVEVRWVVIDARVKRWWPDRDVLTFWSDKQRPVVDIALAGGNHRWEFPLRAEESEDDFATNEQLWPLLKAMGVAENDVEIHQHAFYRHHVRMADRWRMGRVFLVGDAAHLMPPWAGAGMQSGIRDAFDIGWKLAQVLGGRMPDTLLDTYQAERQPNVAMYTRIAVELGRIIKQELSEQEMAALAAAPPEGTTPPEPPLLRPPHLEAGWVRGPLGEDSVVGKMIPQPRIASPRGVITRLDDLLGDGFVLLGDDVDPATALSEEEKAGWDALDARYVAVRPASKGTEGQDEIVDLDGVVLEWLRGYGARVVALRPDRFVAAADRTGLAVPD
ncbi:MAG: bifunctional 3-(3-hydroxy-phenyl)propionate/3-hydroxycinnamic acid hydroxylase [Pseudonocardia sp.]